MEEINDLTTTDSSEDTSTRTTRVVEPRLWQTTVRESLLPWLPPPVTKGIHAIDAALSVYLGPEPTITVTVTLLLAWLVFSFLQRLVSRRSGRAIKTVDDDPLLSNRPSESYAATVLLIGPRNAGKTRLFYQLCYSESGMPTVMSLKPNVGLASLSTDESTTPIRIRYMDWPGHAPIHDLASMIAPNVSAVSTPPVRVVLVLDATQPVAAAAEILFQILTLLYDGYRRRSRLPQDGSSTSRIPPTVFVACHKKDISKAKNDKRIKIQIRTELERLIFTIAAQTFSRDPADFWWNWNRPPSAPAQLASVDVDLDELPFVRLYFCPTSCAGDTISSELVEFCRTGVVASLESTTPS